MNYKALLCIFALFTSNSRSGEQEVQQPLISLRSTLANAGAALQLLAGALSVKNPEPILGKLPEEPPYLFIKPRIISLISLIQRLNTFFKDKSIDFNITDWLRTKSLYFCDPAWQTTIENYNGFGSTMLDRFDVANPYHWGTALAVSGTAVAITSYTAYKLCQATYSFVNKTATTLTTANKSKKTR